ncbi:MAG: type II toxin-antitoxin system HicB family antitoxin [Saprospiraceae bacterium]
MNTIGTESPKPLFIVHEDLEGGYIARCPQFSIYTQGDTWEELIVNIKEAILCHFDDAKAPTSFTLHTVKREEMAL